MDPLQRWRQPQAWRKPGRVALANVADLNRDDYLVSTLLDAGAEVLPTPLRDGQGAVTPDVAESDVVVSGGARLDEAFFASLRTTRHLCRPYVGYDDIDVDAATAHGILVTNVPDAITDDVANQALALILAANRQVPALDRFVRDGSWATRRRRTPEGMIIHRPTALTLGLVGFGNIGRATAERAKAFGFRIVANDPYVGDDVFARYGVTPLALEDLLRQADIVSLHVYLSAETRHLMDEAKFAMMKPTAWLINTSRGPVIDEVALTDVLSAGRIAGAGLDVFEQEPLDPQSPLMAMDNVILCPHVAGYSEEGAKRLRTRAGEIALQTAQGGLPQRHTVINKGLYDELAALPELGDIPRP